MQRITSGFTEISICRRHECAGCDSGYLFKSQTSIEMSLQSLKNDHSAMINLRAVLHSVSYGIDVARFDNTQVISQILSKISCGDLRVCGKQTSETDYDLNDPIQKAVVQALADLQTKTENFIFAGQTLRFINAQEWKKTSLQEQYQLIPQLEAQKLIDQMTTAPVVSQRDINALKAASKLIPNTLLRVTQNGLYLLRYKQVRYVKSASSEPAITLSQLAKLAKKDVHWIEIELVGEDGKPIANQNYLIVTADQKQYTGATDADGLVHLDNIPEGKCQVSFPDLDKEAWAMA